MEDQSTVSECGLEIARANASEFACGVQNTLATFACW